MPNSSALLAALSMFVNPFCSLACNKSQPEQKRLVLECVISAQHV